MDNKNVSTLGIAEGIDYLEKEFIAVLDKNTEEAVDTYTKMQSSGALSSANIDSITNEIKGKVLKLQSDFDELSQRLKQGMFQSQEEIERHRNEIENQLGNGTY